MNKSSFDKNYIFFALLILSFSFLSSCDENDNSVNSDTTSTPKINSLSSDKSEIVFGGEDPAIITCEASGGNLEYLWEVDLGDIIPMNEDASKVRFTGSSCCVGEKVIKCTVKNDKGSDSKEVKINILEEMNLPEIFGLEAEKLEVKVGESISIKCFAVGGSLKYQWTKNCGDFSEIDENSWELVYTPNQECIGKQSIKCSVSNLKGFAEQTIDINVIE